VSSVAAGVSRRIDPPGWPGAPSYDGGYKGLKSVAAGVSRRIDRAAWPGPPSYDGGQGTKIGSRRRKPANWPTGLVESAVLRRRLPRD